MFQTVLSDIDMDFPQTPIFVFGYSQMQRGISYRSSNRVPSHMVLHFGKAMSLCRLVQAAGRANGKQADTLCRNMNFAEGQAKVKLLTTTKDFDAIRNYPAFLENIRMKMLEKGLTLAEALKERYDGRYGAAGNRLVGPKKVLLRTDQLHFLEVSDDELRTYLPGEAYEMSALPGLMHPILRVLLDAVGVVESTGGMTVKEIIQELSSTPEYQRLMTAELCHKMSTDARAWAADIRATLEHMMIARINVSALVDKSTRGSSVLYAITDRGEYVVELKEGRDDRSSTSATSEPWVRRSESALSLRSQRLCPEECGWQNEDLEQLPSGLAHSFCAVSAFPGHVVMLGCLGGEMPPTFSRLFCPLIFLAANPGHERLQEGMAFWGERFSYWTVWVCKLRNVIPERGTIDYDGGVAALMYGDPQSFCIPHYSASAQVEILEAACIKAEVDACALSTFLLPPRPPESSRSAADLAHAAAGALAAYNETEAANGGNASNGNGQGDAPMKTEGASSTEVVAYRSLGSGPSEVEYRSLGSGPSEVEYRGLGSGPSEVEDEEDGIWWGALL